MAKYIAVAASAALPPAARISRPISAACGSSVATPPKKPSTASSGAVFPAGALSVDDEQAAASSVASRKATRNPGRGAD